MRVFTSIFVAVIFAGVLSSCGKVELSILDPNAPPPSSHPGGPAVDPIVDITNLPVSISSGAGMGAGN
jgi:hypothetical protein